MLALVLFLITRILVNAETPIEYDDSSLMIENFKELNKNSLNWGPYRSNLYLGIRPRIPDSFMSGLMWFPTNNFEDVKYSKYECKQDDNIEKFGWTRYDPRYGGREIISDNDSNLTLTIDFVKSEDGKNWGLKIKGETPNEDDSNSLVFYSAIEESGYLDLADNYIDGTVSCVDPRKLELKGSSTKLDGEFTIEITEDSNNVHPKQKKRQSDKNFDPFFTHHLPMTVPMDTIWQAKDIFWTLIKMNAQELHKDSPELVKNFSPTEFFQLRNTQGFDGNTHFIQKTFKGNFEFDIIFNTQKSEDKISSNSIKSLIEESNAKMHEKFARKFQLQPPFNELKYVNFAKETISQLLGGIGYFYGDQLVDRDVVIDDVSFSEKKLIGKSEGPYELFSSVPSRSFFPRGFYWDEGFHLLPILDYDPDLALEIVKSWFSLIDEDGWIGREQILGDEARSKVPEEFVVQNHNIANPPTLMMVFSELFHEVNKFKDESFDTGHLGGVDSSLHFDFDLKENLGDNQIIQPELLIDYAHEIYPKLQKHYEWFRRTQKGEVSEFERKYLEKTEVYRWKGRTREHCLPSGLDDYPRCSPDIGEVNIDLMSWMAVMSRSMNKIAKLLDKDEDAERYLKHYFGVIANMNREMWSEKDQSYCDLTVDDDDEDVFECHIGYVTLMPFIHKLIPSKATVPLFSVLGQIYNPKKLWTPFGIRSLSKGDMFFHKGEDYWRGNIWININYLILESLLHYGSDEGVDYDVRQLSNEIYIKLRENLINNIYNEYERTGIFWEQYNEMTGEGRKTKHFTGWTTLVILMMNMPEKIF